MAEPPTAGLCRSLLAVGGSGSLVLGSTQPAGVATSAGGTVASIVSSGAVLGATMASVLE